MAGRLFGAVEHGLTVRRHDNAIRLGGDCCVDELALLTVIVVAALVVHRDPEIGGSLLLALLDHRPEGPVVSVSYHVDAEARARPL